MATIEQSVKKSLTSVGASRYALPMTTARRSQSDPKPATLRELAEKQSLFEEVQAALFAAVQDARDAGCSWAEIATATGLASKQAAFDKWAKRIEAKA